VGSNCELIDFRMGRSRRARARSPRRAAKLAEAAGLVVIDLRQESLQTVFNDIGRVVHLLRDVPWTVPGFTVEDYPDQLLALHEHVEEEGPVRRSLRKLPHRGEAGPGLSAVLARPPEVQEVTGDGWQQQTSLDERRPAPLAATGDTRPLGIEPTWPGPATGADSVPV